jgi:hypothetical protein
MRESREAGSKRISERDEQSLKQDIPSVSTDEGIQMDESDSHLAKARWAKEDTFEGEANMTSERERQSVKQWPGSS